MSFILLGILNSQVEATAAGAFDLLETTVLSTSATSVTFSSLGSYSDYKHLQLRMTMRNNNNGDYNRAVIIRFNGDTSSSYRSHNLSGNGTAVSSTDFASTAYIAWAMGDAATTSAFSTAITDILDYSSASKNTTVRSLSGLQENNNSTRRITLYSGLWNNTAAVTSLTLLLDGGTVSFASGSRFSLYGIKG